MLVVVDYGMGNLASITNMLKRLGVETTVSSDPTVIANASKVILPGVGSFDVGMRNLTEMGLIPVLDTKVLGERTPVLGICLGMQLMTKESEEGSGQGLGWLDAKTIRFRSTEDFRLKVPHMGWNSAECTRPSNLFTDMDSERRFYFVHSYHVVCAHPANELATTTYGYKFTSAFANDNVYGVQFHPEKSHKYGMQLMKDFAERG